MHLKSFMQKDRYGNEMAVEFFDVPPMQTPEYDHPGEPKGPDTVPAWLTPGEYVVNAEAVRMFEPQIEAMNEAGRELQRAQGGTIPEYKGEGGGIIQGITDYFTMPPAPPGIEYRRMPDGSIGQFTEKTGTGGGQRYLGRLEESKPSRSRREDTWDFSSMFNSQGGPIYAAEGQLTETDKAVRDAIGLKAIPPSNQMPQDILANFLKQHEGLKNEAYLDSAGVPTIGYGSTYGVKIGDKLSDAEANQKLIKDIQVAENDYNNLVDVDLNPNQQAAVKSLIFNIGGPKFANSRARAALNDGDFETFQKEASEFRMADGKVLPGLENRRAAEMSLFNTPVETFNKLDVPPEENKAPPKPSPAMEEYLATAKKNNVAATFDPTAGDDASDFFNVEDMSPTGDFRSTQAEQEQQVNVMDTGNALNAAIARKESALEEVKESQKDGTLTPAKIAELDAAVAAIPPLEKENKKARETQTETNIATAQAKREMIDDADAAVKAAESGEIRKPSTGQTTASTNPDLASKVQEAITATEGNKTPDTGGQSENEVIDEGNKTDPTMLDNIKGWFSEAFSDMFSGPELARMAMLYAGSRALGYDHGGSLNYSMKSYMKRVDADIEARQSFITDEDNLAKYTTESLANYRKSGDVTDLEEKPTAYSAQGLGELYEHETLGTLQSVKVGKDKYAVEIDGQYVPLDHPAVRGKIRKHEPKYDNAQEVENFFSERATNMIKGVKAGLGEDQTIPIDGSLVAADAAARYMKDIKLFGDRPDARFKLRNEMLKAQDDYFKAYANAIKNGTDVPKSVISFYNKRAITFNTKGAVSQDDIKGADTETVLMLDDKIMQFAGGQGTNPKTRVAAYRATWSTLSDAWKKNGKESKFKNFMGEGDAHSPFTYWASQVLDKNSEHHEEAMKLLQE